MAPIYTKESKLLTLPATLLVQKMPLGQEISYELNEETPWIAELLQELQEDLVLADNTDANPIEAEKQAYLKVTMVPVRKHHPIFRDHLVITGQISSHFARPCVRCLRAVAESVELPYAATFLSDSFAQDDQYEETDEIFAYGLELDLFFQEQGKVDLKELVHQYLYLNINPLPLHDEQCKGLCPECGTDLNLEQCRHQSEVHP